MLHAQWRRAKQILMYRLWIDPTVTRTHVLPHSRRARWPLHSWSSTSLTLTIRQAHTHTYICYTMRVLSFVLYVFHDSWCHSQFFVWVRVTHVFTGFCVGLLSVFTFWFNVVVSVTDFRQKTMSSSSLPPVVCMRTHVLFTLFVFDYA